MSANNALTIVELYVKTPIGEMGLLLSKKGVHVLSELDGKGCDEAKLNKGLHEQLNNAKPQFEPLGLYKAKLKACYGTDGVEFVRLSSKAFSDVENADVAFRACSEFGSHQSHQGHAPQCNTPHQDEEITKHWESLLPLLKALCANGKRLSDEVWDSAERFDMPPTTIEDGSADLATLAFECRGKLKICLEGLVSDTTAKVLSTLYYKWQKGQLISYQVLALWAFEEERGHDAALKCARMVGTALNKNPILVLIPCHIVMPKGLLAKLIKDKSSLANIDMAKSVSRKIAQELNNIEVGGFRLGAEAKRYLLRRYGLI